MNWKVSWKWFWIIAKLCTQPSWAEETCIQSNTKNLVSKNKSSTILVKMNLFHYQNQDFTAKITVKFDIKKIPKEKIRLENLKNY